MNDDNKTPLHYAAENGHLNVVTELIKRNADTKIKDSNSKTALQLAQDKNHQQIVNFLRGK